jgi:large subunit ribosomal protein L25
MSELEVTCLPADLPEFIEVDLASIDVGHSIHVDDLTLPKGVTALTHGQNLTVATAAVPAGHVAADAIEAAASAAASEADAATKAAAAKPKK